MITKKILLFVVAVLTLSGAVAGYRWWKISGSRNTPERRLPDVPDEVRKLMSAFSRADSSAEISGRIRIYDQENKGGLKETRSFRFFRCGAGYFSQLSYLQTYCDGVWLVQLDSVHRRVQVFRAPRRSAMNIPGGNLDSLFSDTSRLRVTGSVTAEGGLRKLCLHDENIPGLRSSTLLYDTLSYRMIGAEMEWLKSSALTGRREDKIWLAKIDYSYSPPKQMDLAKMIHSIITVRDSVITLTEPYQGYETNIGNN